MNTFRYHLSRTFADTDKPRRLLYVMLNPSTADSSNDDPTIRRCTRFAQMHAFDALEVVNLYAFRATDPRQLVKAGYPIGEANDHWLYERARSADAVCLAWGAHAPDSRAEYVISLLRRAHSKPLMCLGKTKAGKPRHPLYVPGCTTFTEY